MFGDIIDAIVSFVGSLGSGAASLGSSVGSAIENNPFGALSLGLQGASAASPFFLGSPGGGQQIPDVGLNTQLQQPGGANPTQVKARLADTQASGLSGASPDFLASMAGMTPRELEQMMGLRPGQGY